MGTSYIRNFLWFTLSGISPTYPQDKEYLMYEEQRGGQERCQHGTPVTVFKLLHHQYIMIALQSVSASDMVEPLGHLLNIPPNQVGSGF